ncbi:MAG: TROVE domain-containing protein [Rhodospirillaceae bacterium]|nr:TROVE domain-containing protein [Rhodospirillaceae bacterium]
MSYKSFLQMIFPSKKGKTPQNQPLPEQIANQAGGFYYALDDWIRLDRFLILGSDSGTYYVAPKQLTKDNAQLVVQLLKTDGIRVVERIVEMSSKGRAPKNDSALFALALAAAADDVKTRQAALAALPKVARTGAHLLMFISFVHPLRGWGRSLRKAFANWFLDMPVENLSLQSVKYRQRDGWSLRDTLRLSHVRPTEEKQTALIDWIVHPENPAAIAKAQENFRLITGFQKAKEAINADVVAEIIREYSLPREAVPNQHLNDAKVWDALLVDMPMTAMIRNLGKMSQVDLLKPFSHAATYVAKRLQDQEQLKKARIHPIQLLIALRTYAQGRGELGSLAWTPVTAIITALNEAFDLAFKQVEPSGKRILVGIDVSGSMQHVRCLGSSALQAIEAASAMAALFVRTEKQVHSITFDTQYYEFPITASQRLDDIIARIKQWGGGTDISLPVKYALDKKVVVDVFVIITDSETWAGREHPVQTLQEYRQRINPKAKLVVLATTANAGSIVEPNDPLSFGVAGFDANVPELVSDFIRQTV